MTNRKEETGSRRVGDVDQQKLPGLNGLRAVAASYVLVAHFYQIAGVLGDKNAENICNSVFHTNWFDPVNLFFTLSGFIITLLLLKEKAKTGSISLKTFYIKRLLRIWPLYFLVFFLVYLLGAYTKVYADFAAFNSGSFWVVGLFLVTMNVFFMTPLSVLLHYWSISVEEQFYLFWPLLLKKFHIVKICLVVLVLVVGARNGAGFLANHSSYVQNLGYSGTFQKWKLAMTDSKFSSMAIGGLTAFFFWSGNHQLSLFRNVLTRLLIWIAFFLQFFFKPEIPFVNSEIQSLLYAALILVVIQGENPFLDSKILDITGQISYGVYMYHWPLIPIVIMFFKKYQIYSFFSFLNYIPLVVSIYLFNYIIAYCSFFYFESKVLKLKKYFKI